MKESRLFKIVYHLLSNGKTTALELSQQFEVSVRTIYRDIDRLSEAGIPIYTTNGRNGGVQLLDTFVLRNTLLSAEEQQTILLALQSMATANVGLNEAAFLKLQALFQVQAENWLAIDFSQWHQNTQANEQFDVLKQAIIQRNQLQFNYLNAQGQSSRRCVQPVKLLYKSNAWYLQAFCLDKQAFRNFKLHRIRAIKNTNEVFAPLVLPQQAPMTETNDIQLVLHFSKEILYRVYDEFDFEAITLQEDGSGIVSAALPDKEWLLRYLLSFGQQIKILAPTSIREKFLVETQAMLTNNSTELD